MNDKCVRLQGYIVLVVLAKNCTHHVYTCRILRLWRRWERARATHAIPTPDYSNSTVYGREVTNAIFVTFSNS